MGRKAPERKAPPAPVDKAKAPAETKPAEPTTEQATQAEPQPQVWTTDTGTLKGFWAAWKGKGLTEDEVNLTLNVTHLVQYTGSMSDAAKILQPIADKKATAKKA